jgi:LacI family transcriptional regulator
MKRPTINDVAKLAGVSKSTISYVISGKRPIGEDVTAKVLAAMEELNYKPSVLARNLAERKTYTIGLYGPSAESLKEDLFFNFILSGILSCLNKSGYRLLLNSEKKDDNNKPYYELDSAQPIDGAIIMNPQLDEEYVEKLKTEQMPFVILGRPAQNSDVFFVDNDNTAAVYTAVNYLIEKGHSKIAFINGPYSYVSSADREKGFRLAHEAKGLELNEALMFNCEVLEDEGYKVCDRALERGDKFTAVVTFNDIVAVGVIKALQERKIKVPDKVAVLSEGDTLISRINSPTMTTIDMNAYDLGYKSAELLLEVISRKRINSCNIIVPFNLITREST